MDATLTLSMSITAQSLQVRRQRPDQWRWQTDRMPALADGELLLRLERFGLSANNVSYATLADALHYGDFFPSEGDTEYSTLPVWGCASVVESRSPLATRGQRVYGLFPCASLCRLRPATRIAEGFAVERLALPAEFAFYHRYAIAGSDPLDVPQRLDAMVVLRPLFLTSLLLADALSDERYAGVEQIVLSSAGSRTALATAACLAQAGQPATGLASQPLPPTLRRWAAYRDCLDYTALEKLPRKTTIYVDLRGNAALRERLAAQLGDQLRLVLSVGLTDWQGAAPPPRTASYAHELFFAPGWAARRGRDPSFAAQMAQGWQRLLAEASDLLPVRRCEGAAAIGETWVGLVAGRQDQGQLLIGNFDSASESVGA